MTGKIRDEKQNSKKENGAGRSGCFSSGPEDFIFSNFYFFRLFLLILHISIGLPNPPPSTQLNLYIILSP